MGVLSRPSIVYFRSICSQQGGVTKSQVRRCKVQASGFEIDKIGTTILTFIDGMYRKGIVECEDCAWMGVMGIRFWTNAFGVRILETSDEKGTSVVHYSSLDT